MMIQSFCLMLARFAVSAWLGAAVLFVIVGIREVRTPEFGSEIRDMLVLVRFPAYYAFGSAALVLGLLGTLGARLQSGGIPARRTGIAACLLVVAIGLMLADYFWIYTPLAAMITPAGSARPSHFQSYHAASEWINAAGLVVAFGAALLLCWPDRRFPDRS